MNLGSVVFANSGEIVGIVSKIFAEQLNRLFLCTLIFESSIYDFISEAEVRSEADIRAIKIFLMNAGTFTQNLLK